MPNFSIQTIGPPEQGVDKLGVKLASRLELFSNGKVCRQFGRRGRTDYRCRPFFASVKPCLACAIEIESSQDRCALHMLWTWASSGGWYVHLRIATWRTGIHGCGDTIKIQLDSRPLRIAENHQRDFPAGEILLVPNILVGAEKHVVTGFLGPLDQFAVFQLMSADLPGTSDVVAGETASNRLRSAVIEQDFHRRRRVLSRDFRWRSAKRPSLPPVSRRKLR